MSLFIVDASVVTADEKFFNSLSKTTWAASIMRLQDVT